MQNGTSLQELQQLGGWSSYDMVLRYAHLSSDHLKDAAERIVTTNLGFHRKMKLIQRRAYGFRNFENYRLRVKVLCA